MSLHNFIKDENDDDNEGRNIYNSINSRLHEEATTGNSERAFPLVTDNNELLRGGRPSTAQEWNRRQGECTRRSITMMLQAQGLRRPLYNGMKYNQFGHVFFDGV